MKEPYVRPFQKEDAGRASEVLVGAFQNILGENFDALTAKHFSAEILIENAESKDKFNESKTFVPIPRE